ncbi:MAG TPA: hypothetical protein VFH06_02555 [Candidatus Saccharimonadales bacterium]|nr:hypothetical protein [Candidatus Saccharimonadales bacterium]
MKRAVVMLYGPYGQHPWQEDMFHRPDKIQSDLKALGYGFAIAMVTHAPTGKDEIPEVRVAEDPLYDQKTGILLEAHFKPGNLEDYPSIIDHWVHNFQDEVQQADGTFQRTAYGIGLPPERVWNHKNVQTFGNRKELMNKVIVSEGVGIPTFAVLDYAQFTQQFDAYSPVIYKPQGGSRGIGIEVFKNIKELHAAIQTDQIATNGFIQPYLRNNQPIEGVKPLTKADDELLKKYNTKTDRPREIRMHVIACTTEAGELLVESYPIMKVSEPHLPYLKFKQAIGLDPSCLGPGSFIYDKTVALARTVCAAAEVPQYYGVFDWLVDGDIHNPKNVYVVDGNCRGPGLPENALPAREAFQRALVTMGERCLGETKERLFCEG